MSAKLVIPKVNTEYPLQEGPNTIGRHPENNICLPGRAVSRFHAEIRLEGSAWILEDHGSSYGTYVNGKRVEGAMELHDGDAIRLAVSSQSPDGEHNLVFRLQSAAAASEAPKSTTRAIVGGGRVDAGKMVFERGPDLILVRMSGIFLRREVDALAERVKKELAASPKVVVLDVAGVRSMNSYALSMLVALAGSQKEQGQSIRIFGATGAVRKLLLMPGENSPLQLCADEAEALGKSKPTSS
jgi:anti-anti-sigma factor